VAGVPPLLDSRDVYAADRPGRLAAAVRGVPERVYVPNTRSDTVSVIDPATFKVIGRFKVGRLPQHVVPSYDLRTLWATNDYGNSLTPIDPRSGRPGTPVPVADPYNMYFTADGRFAIVVAEALERLDFRDAHTMRLRHSVHVSCQGVDHMDFSADGRFALASCEFSGQLLWVDVAHQRLARVIRLGGGSMPQDVKLSPDGKSFYVADKATGGVHVLDARSLAPRRFIRTGSDAHGLSVSRDSRSLYVSNRGVGTVSVISFAAQRVSPRGASRVVAAPTWAASRPTGRCCGWPGATTARSTRLTPGPAGSWPGFPWDSVRTAWRSFPSRAATPSGTPASFADRSARCPPAVPLVDLRLWRFAWWTGGRGRRRADRRSNTRSRARAGQRLRTSHERVRPTSRNRDPFMGRAGAVRPPLSAWLRRTVVAAAAR